MSLNEYGQLISIVCKVDAVLFEKLFGKRKILGQNRNLVFLLFLFNFFLLDKITGNRATFFDFVDIKSKGVQSGIEGGGKMIRIELLNLKIPLYAGVRSHFNPVEEQLRAQS